MRKKYFFFRGEERSGGEKNSADFHMKSSSSSEESVRKRSHSLGGNSLAPSTLSTLTATNICDINDAVMDNKQDTTGKCLVFSIFFLFGITILI